ncbi:MAG: YDG domain-containing protein, partial [Desulfobacterales bacterium]
LTVSGDFAADDKTYDGTTDATISEDNLGLDNTVTGDDVRLDPTAAFEHADAGANLQVDLTSGSALSGDDNANYSLDLGGTPTTTATIDPRALDVDGSRTYDGTTTVSAGNLTLSNLVSAEDLDLSGDGSMDDKHAGTDKDLQVDGLNLNDGTSGQASNYTFTGGSHTVTIDPRALTVSGDFAADDKTYDGTTAATISENNLDLDNTVAGDTVGLDPTAAFTETGPGQAFPVELISVSTLYGVDAGNYTLDLSGAPTTTASITGLQSGSAENAAISDVSRLATSEFGGQESGDGDTDSRAGPPDQGETDRRSGSGIRTNVEIIATGIRLPDFMDQEEQE